MASNNPLRVTEDEAEEISQYTCTAPFHKNQENGVTKSDTVDIYSSSPVQASNTNGTRSECVNPSELSQYNPHSLIDAPMDEFDEMIVKLFEYPGHNIEQLTLEKMMSYILSREATVPVCLCLAVVSGLPQCGKTKSIEMMLQKSIEIKDGKNFLPFQQIIKEKVNKKSLSSYDLCVLGSSPFSQLSWMLTTKRHGVTMCLLSYFVRLCTHRNIPCEQLQFISSSANIEDPLLNKHVMWLFEMLQKRWKKITKEEEKRFVLQTGICFLNIFDVGPSKAMYEFLPFLNRYCSKAVNVVCYSGHRDANKLHEPLQEIDDQNIQPHLLFPNQPRGKQMFHGTAGSQNTPAVFVANDASSSSGTSIENAYTHATEYIDGLVRNGGNIIQHQHSQFNQQRETKDTKHLLEGLVVKNMEFYDSMPLRFMILRSALSSESPPSFWKTRKELERLSQHCHFRNGDMDNFLKLFSSYGSILYFHDIPSLRKYVVINVWEFTQRLHELYYSKEETASNFGLLKQRVNEKDWEMIFILLTNLQIAAEVSPNKLVFESSHIPIHHKGLYYYLPSAREMPPENSPSNESFYIRAYSPTCIPGNMQACLVQYLMKIPQCMLVPTQPINSTTVRFIDDSCPPLQIKIVNHGDKIELQLADSTIVHSLDNQVEICKKVIEACCYALNVTTNNIQYTFSIHCAEGNTFHDCNEEIDCDQCKKLRKHWIDAYKHINSSTRHHLEKDAITPEEYAQFATALDKEIHDDSSKISSLCEELKIEDERTIQSIPGWQKYMQIFLLWEKKKGYMNCSKKELSAILLNLGIRSDSFPV